ncbi:hypothetical protein BFJ70_g16603 [Fusarium oxysporum]|nr:hypothetical protein BFJ70_g16603 [Fusarium oxysporum]
MATVSTTTPWKQAPEAISMPTPSAPSNSFAPPILPSLPPPSGGALPVHTQFQTVQLKHHVETQRLDEDIQKLSHIRIFGLIENHDRQISELKDGIYALKEYLPTRQGQRLFRNLCHILQDVEQIPKDIRKQVTEAKYYSMLRNRENDIQKDISRFVSTMRNQTPTNPWRFNPENSEASSSEWASSDYEPEQKDPEVAESSDQHGSSAPLSSTFGSGNMDEGEASPSECSETVPSELCASEKMPTPGAARLGLLTQQSASSAPPVPFTKPLSDSERSLSLKLLMFLSTIDHASSPSDANSDQRYDEAEEYQLPQLIERYFERLCKRFELSPRRPIACGIAQYHPAYDILRKAVQPSEGRRLEPLHLNTEVDDHFLGKELTEREWIRSAIGNGKLLAEFGRYYDVAMDESPYIKISVKLARLIDELNKLGDGIATQTVRPTAENLLTCRRQLQQLRSMPHSKKHGFETPIAELSTLFEKIGMSNDTYNRSINDLRLHLYRCLSFKLPSMSTGFGLLDEVDDEHPPSDSTSGSSTSTDVLKLLGQQNQICSEQLNLKVTQSLQILQSRLEENNATNPQELSMLIHNAQALQGGRHQNVLHTTSIVYHQQMLKWAEKSSVYHRQMLEMEVKQGKWFLLEPESENSKFEGEDDTTAASTNKLLDTEQVEPLCQDDAYVMV